MSRSSPNVVVPLYPALLGIPAAWAYNCLLFLPSTQFGPQADPDNAVSVLLFLIFVKGTGDGIAICAGLVLLLYAVRFAVWKCNAS